MRLKTYNSSLDYFAEDINRRIVERLLNMPQWRYLLNNRRNEARNQ